MKWLQRFKQAFTKPPASQAVGDEPAALQRITEGNTFEDAGAWEQAMACYDAALALAPQLAKAHLSRGNIFLATGQLDAALAAYAKALECNPRYAAAHYNAGNVYLHLERREEALACYAQAVAAQPDFADAHVAQGCVLEELNRFEQAEASYRRALQVQPDYAEAHSNLGNALLEMGRYDDAVASHRRALELNPGFADGHNNLGLALQELGRFDDAIASFQKALALQPDFADAHYIYGSALLAAGKASDAVKQYRRAIELDQMNGTARWALAMAHLRPIYDNVQDMLDARAGFAAAIADLDAWFTPARAALGTTAVGSKQPFFLAYQARDNRALLEPYGQLCARLMAAGSGPASRVPKPGPLGGRKLRLGVVSAQVRDHSVWVAITKGWIEHLDPKRFEVLVFHVGRYRDQETARARSEATDFIDTPRTVAEWSDAIAGAQLDVLIYPEVGMDMLTTQLAAQRLVAVQMASWGHPHTTGLPTIDVFLSADLLEPPQADAHYSEKLVRLPHLGVCVEPLTPHVEPLDLSALGLPSDEPLVLCAGTPFKYSPEDDAVWLALGRHLQAIGKGRLVFFESARAGLTQQLQQRLRRAFVQQGLDFDRTVSVVPTLPRGQFYGLMQRACLMLDTIGFSGFNTALQALECGLPVVAFDGAFMRGRLASALLRRVGLDAWIAGSHAEFVDKAMQLVNDPGAVQALRQQIAHVRGALFNDLEPVRALEQVLLDAVHL